MRRAGAWLVSLPILLLLVSPAGAQGTGAITGRVVAGSTGEPIAGARVEISGAGNRMSALSDGNGRFHVSGLAEGTHAAVALHIGYRQARADAIEVVAGDTAVLEFALSRLAPQLETMVVTVSRSEERAQDAPASVSIVSTEEIEETPALTPAEHVKDAPGVDIARTGVMQANLVTRGFNDIFASSLLMLTDHRYDFIPSLRVNAPWLIPAANEDIERIEVQLGPGAAVYGPNAAAGVLHIITKSPFDWQGTTFSTGGVARGANAAGGSGMLRRGAIRHAGLIGERFGYKISGQVLSGEDWPHRDPVEVAARQAALDNGADESTLRIGRRSLDAERWSVEGRAEYRPNEQVDASLALGRSQARSGVELTGLGAAQVNDWTLDYYHARARWRRLFVQGFLNASNAGDTWFLRTGEPIVDRSRMLVGQVQHGFDWGARHTVLYGVDAQRTDPRTGGTITGRNEDRDRTDEVGGYLNVETRLTPTVELFTAARVDHHSRLENVVVSPRAAIVYKPTESHALRLTWNRAFNTPGTNALFLDVVAGTLSPLPYNVRAIGVSRRGLTFGRDCDGRLCMRSPFATSAAQTLPADATLLWPAVVNIVRLRGGPDLSGIPAPTADNVGTVLRVLNPTTLAFDPVQASEVRDIPALRETVTSTFEVGYKGELGERFRVALDVYHERKRNFIGSLVVETPNVFLDAGTVGQAGTLASYLAGFMPAVEAQQLALEIGGTPSSATNPGVALGTVSPDGELAGSPDLLLTYRNFGALSRWGMDGSADLSLTDVISVTGTYSWTTKNLFPASEVGGWADIALNAPRQKGSLALHLRHAPRGLSASLAGRYVEGFPMISGAFVGDVRSYTIADLGAAWRFGPRRDALLSASIQNLFDDRHREFVGAPALGRSGTLQVQYTLR